MTCQGETHVFALTKGGHHPELTTCRCHGSVRVTTRLHTIATQDRLWTRGRALVALNPGPSPLMDHEIVRTFGMQAVFKALLCQCCGNPIPKAQMVQVLAAQITSTCSQACQTQLTRWSRA